MKLNIDFNSLSQRPEVREILEAKEFYFLQGKDVLQEFEAFTPKQDSFWDNFSGQFDVFWAQKGKTQRYTDFVNGLEDGEAHDFALLCARLVAHIDTKACDKLIHNPTGRAIAQTGIRQDDWIRNLILYKKGAPSDNGVLYALNYLRDPENEINIVSEKHLRWATENVVGEKYVSRERTVQLLKTEFAKLKLANEQNRTAAISVILYLPDVSVQWKEQDPVLVKLNPLKLENLVIGDRTAKSGSRIASQKNPQNLILYGPPGTGKTYNSINYAVALCKGVPVEEVVAQDKEDHASVKAEYDALHEAGRITFTTFHQSMSYEDFVEGIKPNTNDDTGVYYEVVDGIFKQVCGRASVQAVIEENTTSIDLTGRRFWKMSLGNTAKSEDEEIYAECLENNYVLLGWGRSYEYSECRNRDDVFNILRDQNVKIDKSAYEVAAINTFVREMSVGDLVIISDGNRKFRAIAEITGEYEHLKDADREHYHQKRAVRWLRVYEPSLPAADLLRCNFMQKTLYELKYAIEQPKLKGLLAVGVDAPSRREAKPHVLIVDEINRGNVSAILGELITLLESDKRLGAENELKVMLPYSKDEFGVPPNLHIIGTMNTADRSVEALDTALRRRFTFEEMMPDPSLLKTVDDVDLVKMLVAINQRLEVLVGRDHTIGHAFFMRVKNLEDLKQVFHAKVIPQLQEYFYGDWEKIQCVLGERFVVRESSSSVSWPKGISRTDELDGRDLWRITNPDTWERAAFQSIYSSNGG